MLRDVALHRQRGERQRIVDAGLAAQLTYELLRIWQLLPHARQIGRAATAIFDYQSIDTGPQLTEEIRLVRKLQDRGRRQHRHIDVGDLQFTRGQRRKARVAQRCGESVGGHVLAQGAVGGQRADATAQAARLE